MIIKSSEKFLAHAHSPQPNTNSQQPIAGWGAGGGQSAEVNQQRTVKEASKRKEGRREEEA